MSDLAEHWNKLYKKRPPGEASWFQPHLEQSLALIKALPVPRSGRVIDVGGGASTLASDLLYEGFSRITVLDISNEALGLAKAGLGERAGLLQWVEGNVLDISLPSGHYDLWHDRAVFHFLMAPEDQAAYMSKAKRSLKDGGHLVIGGFALDGPQQCSGLPVARHSSASLGKLLGPSFVLRRESFEIHVTPAGAEQRFFFCGFQKSGAAA